MAGDPAEFISQFFDDAAAGETAGAVDPTGYLRGMYADIQAPDADPREVYGAMAGMQIVMKGAGYDLYQDDGYQLAGFENRRAFQDMARSAALKAAKISWEEAKNRGGQHLTLETIGEHPVYALEEAYSWIKDSGLPLFAGMTYRDQFGTSRKGFMAALQKAHLDAARQKLRIAKTAIAMDQATPETSVLMDEVSQFHFKSLGLDRIDARASWYLGFDQAELNTLHNAYAKFNFRYELNKAMQYRAVHKAGPNDIVYLWGIVNAYDILQKNAELRDDKELFDGLNITASQMVKEFQRCLDILLRYHIGIVFGDREKLTGVDYKLAMEGIETLRGIIGEDMVELTGDPLRDMREDGWMRSVFNEYGFQSYNQFMTDAQHVYAASLLYGVQDEEPDNETYLKILEALGTLKKANTSLDECDFLNRYGVDVPAVKNMLSVCAQNAVERAWSTMTLLGKTDADKMALVDDLATAIGHIPGFGADPDLQLSMKEENYRLERRLVLQRQAEGLLAYSAVSVPGHFGAFELMREAYGLLNDLEMDITSQEFMEATGLPQKVAIQIDDRYNMLEAVSDWRIAHNPQERIDVRFDCYNHITDLLGTYEKEGSFDKLNLALQYLGTPSQNDVRNLHIEAARELIDTYGRMEILDEANYERAYHQLRAVFEAVDVIVPGGSKNQFTFERLTGLDYNQYADYFAMLTDWRDSAMSPSHVITGAYFAAKDILEQAMKPETSGEDAYVAIAKLSHDLETDQTFLINQSILDQVNLNIDTLSDFVDQAALRAAKENLEKGFAKPAPFIVTRENWREHPYYDFATALNWVHRSLYSTVLHDDPYKFMGLGGRADFMDLMRDALNDMTQQYEQVILRTKVEEVGPQAYLDMLEDFHALSYTLGREEVEDYSRAQTDGLVSFGSVGIDFTQRALRKYGHAAVQDIMKAAGNLPKGYDRGSYQFKKFKDLAHFAGTMGEAEWVRKNGPRDMPPLADYAEKALQARLLNAMNHYKEHPGEPQRGIALGRSIFNLIHDYNADIDPGLNIQLRPWFQEIFAEHEYGDFKNFLSEKADMRICQIIYRMEALLFDEDGEKRNVLPGQILGLLRELGEIDRLVSEGFITRAEVNETLYDCGFSPERLEATKRECAVQAAGVLDALVQDPVNSTTQQDMLLDELEYVLDVAGVRVGKHLHVPENYVDTIREANTRVTAARDIFTDMLRGLPESARALTSAAQGTLMRIGSSLADTQALKTIGLKDDEVQRFGELSPCATVYDYLATLKTISDDNTQDISKYINAIHETMNKAGLDCMDESTLRKLGMKNVGEFMTQVDVRQFRVLAMLKKTIDSVDHGSDYLRELQGGINYMLDLSRLDERYTPETFTHYKAATREHIAGLVNAKVFAEDRYPRSERDYIEYGPQLLKAANINKLKL